MMNKKTIRDIDLKGKRVLVRVDFNVPIENGAITDTTRITAAIPTLTAIAAQGPQNIVLMSHLGRPKKGPDPQFSLAPVAAKLGELMGKPVTFVADVVSDAGVTAANAVEHGGIVLLENTRFYPGEEKNDPELAKAFARYGDVYVNDAFGSAHRAHSSTEAVAKLLPAVAGLLMEKEIEFLSNAIDNPKRPMAAILGGAKVGDKIKVIESLLSKADKVLIGGGMANTFFAAQGRQMGKSLVDKEAIDTAKELLAQGSSKLILPVDAVIADDFKNDANARVLAATEPVPDTWEILDIGPGTVEHFKQALSDCKTIIWNGPMGVFEMPNFAKGTNAIAEVLADLTTKGVITVIGGGDSAAAVQQAGIADKMTHISTGGGASLELLEGQALPGLVALQDK
jgi:phosphoglycerate kinase